MAGLCEGGNEPSGSLKASKIPVYDVTACRLKHRRKRKRTIRLLALVEAVAMLPAVAVLAAFSFGHNAYFWPYFMSVRGMSAVLFTVVGDGPQQACQNPAYCAVAHIVQLSLCDVHSLFPYLEGVNRLGGERDRAI
ncbi:hypothetical protein ANN_06399 [Periplaneta americana]|uniref:Uncharacterized protein n=1 Tax=Periplaneta americana TaxID=6978 RepID=A0ABQ8TF81_PERAM|nr:hypothetical protein ANN_06399 [Periplaneta americana]